jgi:hypothetical protein
MFGSEWRAAEPIAGVTFSASIAMELARVSGDSSVDTARISTRMVL